MLLSTSTPLLLLAELLLGFQSSLPSLQRGQCLYQTPAANTLTQMQQMKGGEDTGIPGALCGVYMNLNHQAGNSPLYPPQVLHFGGKCVLKLTKFTKKVGPN